MARNGKEGIKQAKETFQQAIKLLEEAAEQDSNRAGMLKRLTNAQIRALPENE